MRTDDVIASPAARLEKIASWCFRHRWRVVATWVVLVPACFAISAALGGTFDVGRAGGGGTESQKALGVFSRELPQVAAQSSGEAGEVVFRVPGGLASKRSEITAWLGVLSKHPIVASVSNPFDSPRPGAISRDGTVAVAQVTFKAGTDLQTEPRRLVKTADDLRASGVTTEFGGDPFEGFTLPPSEVLAVLAAIVILLFAFGSIVAMGLPMLTAALGVSVALALVAMWSALVGMPSFVTGITAMIGLGLAIGDVLFIVSRYKTEIAHSAPHAATVQAIGTAGRAVVFAGCTVIISMLGMLLLGQPFSSIALAGATAVLVVVAASVTLVPAMLGFIGHRIDRFSVRRRPRSLRDREMGWHRWGRLVQRRPRLFAVGGFLVLLLAGIPVLSLRLGYSDQGSNAADDTTRKAYDLKAAAFGPGSNGPGLIAVEAPTPAARAVVPRIETAVAATRGVVFASSQQLPSGRAFVITFVPTTGPQDEATAALVHHLRRDVIAPLITGTDARAYVGGRTAEGIEAADLIVRRLPASIAVVLLLSFVLLLAAFRSIVVPLKAVVTSLLSIGAAYGVVVAVFQWGWLGSIVGVGKPGPIEPWIPMTMFAVVFALSMDGEVFLLSRIREEYDYGHDSSVSVVEGLASTARVITSAAAIMVFVFLGTVLGERSIKVMGVGLAAAMLIDATIVRVILVPATMVVIGDRTWWFPRWLDRAIPRLNVEGRPCVKEQAVVR